MRIVHAGGLANLAGGVILLAGLTTAGCAPLPRDANGSPPTARLPASATATPQLGPDERERLTALNRQVLREQDDALARRQTWAAYASAPVYAPSVSLYGGGGFVGRGFGGVGVGFPLSPAVPPCYGCYGY